MPIKPTDWAGLKFEWSVSEIGNMAEYVDSSGLLSAVQEGDMDTITRLLSCPEGPQFLATTNSFKLLQTAVMRGKLEAARYLLAEGCSVRDPDHNSNTILHTASAYGVFEIIESLLDKGLDIDAVDQNGMDPLTLAIDNERVETVELLLRKKCDVHKVNELGESLIHIASGGKCGAVVELLLKYGADVNARIPEGQMKDSTPLHRAVSNSNLGIISILLEHNADVNCQEFEGVTPLHVAVYRRSLEAVRILLKHGASPDLTVWKSGHSPLFLAVFNNSYEIANLLLEHVKDIDAVDCDGKTVLYFSTSSLRISLTESILRFNPSPDIEANKKAFTMAVKGWRKMQRDLVERFERLSYLDRFVDKDDEELFTNSIRKGYCKIASLCLEGGVDGNKQLSVGGSWSRPLHMAVKAGQTNMVKLLIEKNVDLNSLDSSGKAPIRFAVDGDKPEITDLLLAGGARVEDDVNLIRRAISNGCLNVVQHFLHLGKNLGDVPVEDGTLLHVVAGGVSKILVAKDDPDDDAEMIVFNDDADRAVIAELIMKLNIDVNMQDRLGFTALNVACRSKYLAVVQLLLNHNASIYIPANDLATPLHSAALGGHSEICKLLLEKGAIISSRNSCLETPLHCAAKNGDLAVLEILLQNNAEVNASDEHGRTPLHVLVTGDHMKSVKFLVQNGADLERRDSKGKTPLHTAAKSGYGRTVKTLLSLNADINVECSKGFTPLHYAEYAFVAEKQKCDSELHDNDDWYSEWTPEEFVMLLKNEVIKRELLNLNVNQKNMELLSWDSDEKSTRNSCAVELEMLQRELIPNTCLSFHDILLESDEALFDKLKKENLSSFTSYDFRMSLLFDRHLKGKMNIVKRVAASQRRENYLDVLCSYFSWLPRACVENLVKYISDDEILKSLHSP